MKSSTLPVILVALFIAPTLTSAATLVKDEEARAVIILPEKSSPVVANAARVLKAHIKQMSGAELPIRTEDKITGSPSKDQAWVLVGEGKLTEKFGLTSKGLGAGGILLSAKENVLAIIGSDTATDPFGTRYAMTTFLEDKLGVRYLWPGELGKVVPQKLTITIADFQHRFTPKLAQRRIRSMGYHDRLQVGLDNLGFLPIWKEHTSSCSASRPAGANWMMRRPASQKALSSVARIVLASQSCAGKITSGR